MSAHGAETVLGSWEGRDVLSWAELWGVPHLEVHTRLGSTQDRARALAAEGRPDRTMVIADEQTAGRGRSGARWLSEPGTGLWCSLVLPGPAVPYLPLVVGLAVARAAEQVAPGAACRLEWPNDVTIEDRKIAGVLCESFGSGVIAGVGVNTREPRGGYPTDVAERAAALDAWTAEGHLSRSELAGLLVEALGEVLGIVHAASDAEEMPPILLAALHERDALFGRPVSTEQGGPGVALGFTGRGTLLVRAADGRRTEIRSGRVRPASALTPHG